MTEGRLLLVRRAAAAASSARQGERAPAVPLVVMKFGGGAVGGRARPARTARSARNARQDEPVHQVIVRERREYLDRADDYVRLRDARRPSRRSKKSRKPATPTIWFTSNAWPRTMKSRGRVQVGRTGKTAAEAARMGAHAVRCRNSLRCAHTVGAIVTSSHARQDAAMRTARSHLE